MTKKRFLIEELTKEGGVNDSWVEVGDFEDERAVIRSLDKNMHYPNATFRVTALGRSRIVKVNMIMEFC